MKLSNEFIIHLIDECNFKLTNLTCCKEDTIIYISLEFESRILNITLKNNLSEINTFTILDFEFIYNEKIQKIYENDDSDTVVKILIDYLINSSTIEDSENL